MNPAEELESIPEDPRTRNVVQGVVVRVDAKAWQVAAQGREHSCSIRGRLVEEAGEKRLAAVVGDHVDIDLSESPGVIVHVHARRSRLARAATGEGPPREQVLVANVDQVVVVAACRRPNFSSVFVDRVLCAAEYNGLPGVLCLNKVDISREDFVLDVVETYEALGYRVVPTSAETGLGLDTLRECLAGKRSVLSGSSGVGKSSILNALDPSLALRVGKVSHKWKTGTHTTTFSRLIELPFGAQVVDTPGVRNFNVHGLPVRELSHLFLEFRPYLDACTYTDCLHVEESMCGVKNALEEGCIDERRYQSYLVMLEGLIERAS